jgi:beta-glucosidase/6-phospho-beta-glucosidase/beta-galactosidase
MMIRIVAIRKAALAGVVGALAWDVVLRGASFAGIPLFDIVRELGTLAAPSDRPALWWPAGLAIHAMVGALWAIFYAYFFWTMVRARPVFQGLIFSLLPTILALAIAYPQLQFMHSAQDIVLVDPALLFGSLTWREPAGILLGHLIYGAVLGALYTHPVGYRTNIERRPWTTGTKAPSRSAEPASRETGGFIFASGIECSYPTIEGGRWRHDQMEVNGHYRHWARDFELAREIGVSHLRYGPPLHLIFRGRGNYDWSFTDQVIPAMRDMGIEAIVDLCHFGLPDWLDNFQNPEMPEALQDYSLAFARRYPWVRFYTPVNEMYVCAKLSALDGVWNEQRRDERSFVTAVRHMARASALIMTAIARERDDAIFINSESGEFYQACCPDPRIDQIAEFENERRFLPLDLVYAHPVGDVMRAYLREQGMPDEEYEWFMRQKVSRRAILGVDYYEWNEKLIDSEGHPRALGELFGWYVIASQYYERYGRPMMHTETNRMDAREGPHWLWRQWHNVELLRKAGVPIVGFTWYSLSDQADWDIALSQALGTVNPVGLFDFNGDARPVGLAYRNLIEIHRDNPMFRSDTILSGLALPA